MDNFEKKYSRQLLFWPDGKKSQRKLKNKTVTIIGLGALGTVLANHLVRAGVGEIRIADRDFVEESNLQRQMLFDEIDARNQTPKVIAAQTKLEQINSSVKIVSILDDVNETNIEAICVGSDLILDGTDNMLTRFLINDVSIKLGIPWIYGGVVHSRGMTTTIIPGKTPCFRCLFPTFEANHGETCDTVGVLSTVVTIIASYQATEALKILIESPDTIREEMIQLDVWKNDYDLFPFQYSKNPTCPCCQQHLFDFLEKKQSQHLITSLCGRNAIQLVSNSKKEINLEDFYKKWTLLGTAKLTPFLLKLSYEKYELSLFKNGRLLIKGTTDPIIGKRLYSALIGE